MNLVARDGRTGARRATSCESGLLVSRMRTCTCVDMRAHARGVLCGLGLGRGVAGGRPAGGALASGRVHAHRGRGQAPRRTRNPAPASAARALAPARALALVLSVLIDHRASVGLRVFCKHGPLGAFPHPWTPSPSFRWRWLKRGRPPRIRDGQTSFSSRQHTPPPSRPDGRAHARRATNPPKWGSGLPWPCPLKRATTTPPSPTVVSPPAPGDHPPKMGLAAGLQRSPH